MLSHASMCVHGCAIHVWRMPCKHWVENHKGMLDKKTEAQTCNPATTNWQQESSDAGLTWSKPVEISKDLGPWAGSLVGPSNGIQLEHNAAHKGRLVWCGHWGVYVYGMPSRSPFKTKLEDIDGRLSSPLSLLRRRGGQEGARARVCVCVRGTTAK